MSSVWGTSYFIEFSLKVSETIGGKSMCRHCMAVLTFLLLFTSLAAFAAGSNEAVQQKPAEQANFIAKVEGRDFFVYSNGAWEKKFLKGVNMGVTKPGYFPGEFAITKAEYLRWFQYISDMNADVMRVYTIQNPDFYDALLEFNKTSKRPLYLLQGVYLREDLIITLENAYAHDGIIKKEFLADAKNLVDIFHGNAKLPERLGYASGEYKSDVSPYVIGWVLGIEWEPMFVAKTNKWNSRLDYNGKYLYTEGATPFEVFLCEVGDEVIAYEAEKYNTMRPLSYTNWLTTDVLKHDNEPFSSHEDKVTVNTEHIKHRPAFMPGVFAAYHVYPYYPDFLNYQSDYVAFRDETGKINTYRAYLRDLYRHHTMPVMVAEFGVPAARGMAHIAKYSGFNQGQHDEEEQGRIETALMQDIYAEGYCGALLFSSQDEWFKRVWNTMQFEDPSRRPFWHNAQANEQSFGILAFDPGAAKVISDVDGDIDEWKNDKPTYVNEVVELYAKADEKYLYLLAKTKNFDFAKDVLYIAFDTMANQGNSGDVSRKLKFSRPAEFLLQIDGLNNSRIVVDAYYDAFHYIYGEKNKFIDSKPSYRKKDQGLFNTMQLCISNPLFLPQDRKDFPFLSYETGVLRHGNANPQHKDYHSLTDFAVKNGNVEIRIPWQLLNIMDPSKKIAMADLYSRKGIKMESNFVKRETFMDFEQDDGIKGQRIDGVYVGAGIMKSGQTNDLTIGMDYYTWQPWQMPTYHERLKKSYYVLQKAFKELDDHKAKEQAK